MCSSCLVVITGNGLGRTLFPREQILRPTSLILDEFCGACSLYCTEHFQRDRSGLIVRENVQVLDVVDCSNWSAAMERFPSRTRRCQSRSNPRTSSSAPVSISRMKTRRASTESR